MTFSPAFAISGYGVSAHHTDTPYPCQPEISRSRGGSGYSVPMTTVERDRASDPRGSGRDHRHRGLRFAVDAPGRSQGATCRCPPSFVTSAPRTRSWRRWSPRATRTTNAIELRTKMEPGDIAAAVRVVRRRLRTGRPAADEHAEPGAPVSCAVRAARHRPARPPPVGALGVRSRNSPVAAAPARPSWRTCSWSRPTSTRGSSSASTAASAPEPPAPP